MYLHIIIKTLEMKLQEGYGVSVGWYISQCHIYMERSSCVRLPPLFYRLEERFILFPITRLIGTRPGISVPRYNLWSIKKIDFALFFFHIANITALSRRKTCTTLIPYCKTLYGLAFTRLWSLFLQDGHSLSLDKGL
jgi:hypothetical protein